ncbi:MAG: divalent cation transporter [Thaumarchaeota archaeon]|nr:divalent cation transporter [Nitrososphaerota archaeon]
MKLALSRIKFYTVILPLLLIIFMIFYFNNISILEFGVNLPKISIEQIDFVESEIRVSVRNTGHIPVNIVMADVNDRIQSANIEPNKKLERFDTALIHIPFEWSKSKPYAIGLTTEDGIRFEKKVESAFYLLKPTFDVVLLLVTLGIYVGIFPILIGFSWLPFMKKFKKYYSFFLSFTVGLLFFLVIETSVELFDLSQHLDSSFNSTTLILIIILLTAFGLYHLDYNVINRNQSGLKRSSIAISLMISVGIGLHNFGEGIIIGTSINLGKIALGNFLVIGFALHNITEGFAISTPLTKENLLVKYLFVLLPIAGLPTIFGLLVGGFTNSLIVNIIFISLGIGSISYVILTIMKWINKQYFILNKDITTGISSGMCIMYIISIIV